MLPAPRFSPTKQEYIVFDGGYDTTTPPLKLPPGKLRAAQNFEMSITGGYRRIDGYERFEGRPKPSDATYAILGANITGSWSAGNTLTGATSGATGVIITAIDDGSSGEQFVLTKLTGTFAIGENLQIGGTTRAVCNAGQVIDGASTVKLHAQYRNLAADIYRADISAVPGSGSVLGVWLYNDVVYAFRNNAGATATDMFKSTSGGWTNVPLGYELSFTTGTAEIAEGATVTGATSGASAVLKRAVLQTGSYGAGTAAGRLIFASVTGTFQNAENLQVGGVTKAVASGTQLAITLNPGGKFEFRNINFGGSANTKRMYGCDGQNRAFEFDGTTFVPIATGMTNDKPTHISGFKNHLFLSFAGSVQHSGTGTPYQWTLITGAGELAQGDTVVGFKNQPGSADGGALAIFTRNSINILYGSSSANWQLVNYTVDQGALEWSIQHMGVTFMFDDIGVSTLSTSVQYGNFANAAISNTIKNWVDERRSKVRYSITVSEKSQYRLFFSDGSALYVTFDGKKVRGFMPVSFPDIVNVACSGEMNDGTEAMYFGCTDGFVYQLDKGTSFDGDSIESHMSLAFDHSKSPRVLKRYKNAMFEVRGEGYVEFACRGELGYNTPDIGQSSYGTSVASFAAGVWDTGTWDLLVWDGQTLLPSSVRLDGTAENASVIVQINSDYFAPITFTGAILDYSLRRRNR